MFLTSAVPIKPRPEFWKVWVAMDVVLDAEPMFSESKVTVPPLGAGAIVMASDAVPVPPRLFASRFTLLVPAVVGVPVIVPVDVLTTKPSGSPVALKDVGLFDAVI